MKYRSRNKIASDILTSAIGGAIKTKIMYKAYLSHATLKDYLAILQENGLLEVEGDGRGKIYRTTPKGINFVKNLDNLRSYLSNE
jgi:predicted transcriptional regulator